MSPSLGSLLDHKARVWRRTETLDEYRASVPSYDLVEGHDELACASDGQSSVLTDPGPGVILSGVRWVYFDVGPTFQKRDVIEIYAGPTAPAWLEVESWDSFRGHHVEVRAREFEGDTSEMVVES